MKKFMRKRVLIPVGLIAALAIAGIAAAYLTASGSGSGSGDVTASSSALTLHSSALTFANIGQTKTVTITADNPGSSPEHVGTLTVTAAPTNTTSCPAGSFSAGNIQVTNSEVPAGASGYAIGTADITFNDVNAAQDGCIGTGTASLTLGSS
jgi:hypothetical protein